MKAEDTQMCLFFNMLGLFKFELYKISKMKYSQFLLNM